jgi:hypothetical protein
VVIYIVIAVASIIVNTLIGIKVRRKRAAAEAAEDERWAAAMAAKESEMKADSAKEAIPLEDLYAKYVGNICRGMDLQMRAQSRLNGCAAVVMIGTLVAAIMVVAFLTR